MAQYTLTLRQIVNQLQKNNQNIFDDTWTTWSEEHKDQLEQKFIDRFLFEEIAFDSAGRFLFEINAQMRRIIDYYKELYITTQFDYEPLENYNITENINTTNTNQETGTSDTVQNNTGTSISRLSDSPLGNSDLTDSKIISNITDGEDSNTFETDNSFENINNGTNDTTRNMKGNLGVQTSQNMVKQERELIINIDNMILDELEENFLGIY